MREGRKPRPTRSSTPSSPTRPRGKAAAGAAAPGPPENFSTLAPDRAGNYAALGDAPAFAPLALRPGDALYMPCGYWHEVSSGGGVHAAFNYWLHPPDGKSFDAPYASPFWRDDWDRRKRDDPLVRDFARRAGAGA